MPTVSNTFPQDEFELKRPSSRPQQPRRRTTGGPAGRLTRQAFSYFYTTPDLDPERYNPDRHRRTSRDTSSSEIGSSDKSAENDAEEYSVFPKLQKRLLITLIAVAGSISGLSSNIYFPSQNAISRVRSSFRQAPSDRSVLMNAGPQRFHPTSQSDNHILPGHPRHCAIDLGSPF